MSDHDNELELFGVLANDNHASIAKALSLLPIPIEIAAFKSDTDVVEDCSAREPCSKTSRCTPFLVARSARPSSTGCRL